MIRRALDEQVSADRRAVGEILARGPNIFAGYRKLPGQTAQVFTPDGWFRTGDIGYFDRNHFLHVTGRISTLIKTESGEKIQTEDLEAIYGAERGIREVGILEKGGKLVALVVPQSTDRPNDVESVVRAAIDAAGRRLPSYERISDYALTADALPRTRLGKIQRHRLVERFEKAKTRGAQTAAARPMPIEEMSGEDRALLEDAGAHTVWDWLADRYSGKRLTPDTSPQFDLGVDSLEWLNLTFEIAQRSGVEVDRGGDRAHRKRARFAARNHRRRRRQVDRSAGAAPRNSE